MLVRSSVRQRDLAVRAALGGSWWRLVRQMLAEAMLLSLLGALAAIGLAPLLIRVLLALAPQNSPRLESIAVDWRVPLFATAAGQASAIIYVLHILRGEGHTASSASGQRLRNTVVIVEVTLSFLLLVGSGLMFRSLYQLQHIDPGYDPHHILTLLLARNWQLSQQAGRVELLSQIQSRLWALAGVENVTASVPFPLAGGSPPPMEVRTQQASTDLTRIFTVDFHGVLAGYFETLRTPILAGRTFAEDDIARGRNVGVIDQLLANEAFPNESAGGKRIFLPFGEPPWVDVIGVVAHQRTDSLADPGRREQIYFPDSFGGIGMSRYWAIRTAGNPAQYAAAISAAVAEVDKQFVISKVQPMEALVERDQAGRSWADDVLSTVVRQHTAGIGRRMALGGAPAEIFKMVLGHGLLLSALGVVAGLLVAWGVTRIIASILVGVSATDPFTFVAMTGFFLVIAAVASWLPARRATKVDPMVALRYE